MKICIQAIQKEDKNQKSTKNISNSAMNRDALQLTIIFTSMSYFKTFKVSGVRICMKTIDWGDRNQSQLYFKVVWIDTSYHWQ